MFSLRIWIYTHQLSALPSSLCMLSLLSLLLLLSLTLSVFLSLFPSLSFSLSLCLTLSLSLYLSVSLFLTPCHPPSRPCFQESPCLHYHVLPCPIPAGLPPSCHGPLCETVLTCYGILVRAWPSLTTTTPALHISCNLTLQAVCRNTPVSTSTRTQRAVAMQGCTAARKQAFILADRHSSFLRWVR